VDLSFLYKGFLDASFGTMVLYTLVMTHITIVSVTLYLHRYSAHRALEMHPVLKHFFRFWLWLTTGMLTKEWTAVHRKHHVDCETEEDPHSPQIFGLNKVLWEGAELYGVTAALVFAPLFFPTFSPVAGTLAAFAIRAGQGLIGTAA